MQATILMIVYLLTTMAVQMVGFAVSQMVEYEFPTLGLTTFILIFLAAFGLAWPLAVVIAEWLIEKLGYQLEKDDRRIA
jgi:uncharacterized membrane protein YqjE